MIESEEYNYRFRHHFKGPLTDEQDALIVRTQELWDVLRVFPPDHAVPLGGPCADCWGFILCLHLGCIERRSPRQPRGMKSARRRLREGPRECAYCGGTAEHMEIDHIHPRSAGGADLPENITLACRPCNTQRKRGQQGWWTLDGRGGCCAWPRPPGAGIHETDTSS